MPFGIKYSFKKERSLAKVKQIIKIIFLAAEN